MGPGLPHLSVRRPLGIGVWQCRESEMIVQDIANLFREKEAQFLEKLNEGIAKGSAWERVTEMISLENSRKCIFLSFLSDRSNPSYTVSEHIAASHHHLLSLPHPLQTLFLPPPPPFLSR